jgi:hypothetical protein
VDAVATKALTSALVLAMYALALRGRPLTALQVGLCIAYWLVGFRLGYDILMYRNLIEEGRLDRYGPIWATLQLIYGMTGLWWIVHVTILCFIAWPIAELARRTAWPSLALAMMATLPGIGFDYLSLLRQALATAFVIAFHLQTLRGNWRWAIAAACLAYLAHPAAAFALAVLLLIHLRTNLRRLAIAAVAVLAALGSVATAAPDFFEAQVGNIAFLLARYLIVDAVAENETGTKLAMFWAAVLMTPMLLQALARPRAVLEKPFLTTIAFVAGYALLILVSGATVRLLWLLLPIVIGWPLAALCQSGPPYLINVCRGFIIASCAGAALYAVQIAPEHYWAGEYPHEVHFVPD